jgi:predicted aspartyl protease
MIRTLLSLFFIIMMFHSSTLGQKIKQAKAHFKTPTDTLTGDFNTLGIFLVNVQLKANGKTYKFLVDTGAPTAVSSEIAKEIMFDTTASAKIRALDSTRKSMAFVTVDSIYINNTVFTNQTAFVWNVENTKILSCAGIDGILGSNSMNACQVLFDWQLEQMIIAKKASDLKLPEATFETKIHFQGNQKAPYIYSSKPKTRFLVDTGYNGYLNFVSNQKKTIDELSYVKEKATHVGIGAEGAFGYMKPDTSYTYTLYDFQIAQTTIDSIEFEISPGKIPKIGNEFLQNYRVHLNPKKKRLSFHQNKQQHHYPETPSFGISILPNDTAYFISSLEVDGLANQQGIALNDIVISINDIALNPMDEVPCTVLFDIRKLIRTGSSVDLKVQKPSGEIQDCRLHK